MASTLHDAPSHASLSSPRFDAAAEEALATTLARQAAFEAEWLPGGFSEWGCDQDEGVIRFVRADGTGIQAKVQILGSHHAATGSWEWAWNNPHVNDEISRDAESVRAYGTAKGFDPLTTGIIQTSLEECQRMIALAATIVDAQGVHWGAAGPLTIAMTFRDVKPSAEGDVRPAGAADEPSGSLPWLLASWLGSSLMSLAFGRYYTDPMILKRMAPVVAGSDFFALTAAHEARIAPYLLEDMAEIEATLAARGFTQSLRVTNQTGDEITSFASLLEHPAHSTIGFVLINASEYTGVTRTTTFETHFTHGPKMSTSNFDMVSFTPVVRDDAVRFPKITDASALYDIHRTRVLGRARTDAPVPLTRGPDPLDHLDREFREVQERWVGWGYYRWTSDGALVRTWRGAILGAWRGLFPWKQLTSGAQARKRAAVMRRLGL